MDSSNKKVLIASFALFLLVIIVIGIYTYAQQNTAPETKAKDDQAAVVVEDKSTENNTVEKPSDASADSVEAKLPETDFTLNLKDADKKSTSTSLQDLKTAVDTFEKKGYNCAFVVKDIATGQTISYHEHDLYYPASSIKGPYVMSLYNKYQDNSEVLDQIAPLAAATIEDSDNEAYRSLHKQYGYNSFYNWAEVAGVVDARKADLQSMNYPKVSAYDMAKLWEKGYQFLSSGKGSATELLSFFENREVSAMREAISSNCITKAGWFYNYGDYGSEPSASEAGFVMSNTGNYIFALLTNAPGDLDGIKPILTSLDAVHAELLH